MTENSPKGWKTLWEKEKLLVTSNFSFSRSVFKRSILQTREKQGLVCERLKAIEWEEMSPWEGAKIGCAGLYVSESGILFGSLEKVMDFYPEGPGFDPDMRQRISGSALWQSTDKQLMNR